MPSITLSRLGVFCVASLLTLMGIGSATGCTVTTSGGDDGGPPPTGDGGASTCSAEGTGTISVEVTGLPAGLAANVKVAGASGPPVDVSGTTSLADEPAGEYSVTAERVADAHPIVRTVYEATVNLASFCLEGTTTQTVSVSYTAVASSHKLWSTNANSQTGQLVAFGGADLGETGSPAPNVGVKGASGQGASAGNAVAFDKEGNLWTLGGTTVDAPLFRFKASDLGTSGEKTPDRKVTPKLTGCSPSLTALAFDPTGALWISDTCADRILRVSPERLAGGGEFTPEAADIATGVAKPGKLAFDKDGNLWVSGESTLHRFAAASLAEGEPHVPDLAITIKAANSAKLDSDALAFDTAGNLWMSSFAGGIISKLTPEELAPTGPTKEIVPSVSIGTGVTDLVYAIAFDESGGLWMTAGQNKLTRLGPDQLGTSTEPGSPRTPSTIITTTDLGYSDALAFFPAPAGLPLYGRFE